MARKARRTKNRVDLIPASLAVSSPVVGAPTFTVGEMAEQLRPLCSNKIATVERLRGWTRGGILNPVDKEHEGTGTRRKYEVNSIFDAAVLSAIADAGLPIVGQSYLLHALSLVRRERENWTKGERSGQLFLEISPMQAGTPFLAVHKSAVTPNPNARLTILINLVEIFSQVGQHQSGAEQLK